MSRAISQNNQLLTPNNLATLTITLMPFLFGIYNYNADSTNQLLPAQLNNLGLWVVNHNYLLNGAMIAVFGLAAAYKRYADKKTEHPTSDARNQLHASDIAVCLLALGLQALGNFYLNDTLLHQATHGKFDVSGHINAVVTTLAITSVLANCFSRQKELEVQQEPLSPGQKPRPAIHLASVALITTASFLTIGMLYNTAAHYHTPGESFAGFGAGVFNLIAAAGIVSLSKHCCKKETTADPEGHSAELLGGASSTDDTGDLEAPRRTG